MLNFFKKDTMKKIADILSDISNKMYKGYLIKEKELRELMKVFDSLDSEKNIPLFFRDKEYCYNEVGMNTFQKPRKDIVTERRFLKNNKPRVIDYKIIRDYYINYIDCINDEKRNMSIRKECCKNLIAFILEIFLNYKLDEISRMLCLFSYIHGGIKFQDILVDGVIRIYNGEMKSLPINSNISIKKSTIQLKPVQPVQTISKSSRKFNPVESNYIETLDEKTYNKLKDAFITKRVLSKLSKLPDTYEKSLPMIKEHLEKKVYDENYPILDAMGLNKTKMKNLKNETKTRGIKENLFTKKNTINAINHMLSQPGNRTSLELDDFIRDKTMLKPGSLKTKMSN